VPIATLALLLTNDLHGLIWEDTRLVASGSYQMLVIEHGSFFWVLVLYSYACLGLAALLLARNYVHATKLYRAQTGIILAGTLMPWLANAFYLFNSTLFPYLDLTPLAFTLTGLLAAWGLFRYQLLEVGPIYNSAGQMTHFGTVQEAITIQKQTEEALTRLLELSRVLATSRDMDVALVKAVNSAVEIVTAAGRSTLQWLESDGETLGTVATSGTGIHRDVPPFQPGVGIAGYALLNKEIINVPDVLADERFVPGKPPLAFRSLLVAPLIVRDQALGTISLSSEQTHAFSPTDETLVGLMADQIAAALDNARAFTARRHAEEALHRHSERLQILHEIDQSILAARLPETIAVAAIVAKIGWSLSWKSFQELVGSALPPEQVQKYKSQVMSIEGIINVHSFKTRAMGGKSLLEMHIQVSPFISASEGHLIGDAACVKLYENGDIAHIIYHIDTYNDEEHEKFHNEKLPPMRAEIEPCIKHYLQSLDNELDLYRLSLHYYKNKVNIEILLTQPQQKRLDELGFETEHVIANLKKALHALDINQDWLGTLFLATGSVK